MGDGAVQAPGLRRLAWLLLMEPVTLHHHLAEAGVARPAGPLLGMGPGPEARAVARRLALLLGVGAPVVALACAIGAGLVGAPLQRAPVLALIAFNVACALGLGLVTGAGAGTLQALVFTPASVVTLALLHAGGAAPRLALLISPLALAMGVAVATSTSFRRGEAVRVGWVAVRGLGVAVLSGVLAWRLVRAEAAPMAAAAAGLAFCAGALRVWWFPVEAIACGVIWAVMRAGRVRALRAFPVLHHDLAYVPLPLLRSCVRMAWASEPELVRRVLAACFIAPGQRRVGRRLLRELGIRPVLTESGGRLG